MLNFKKPWGQTQGFFFDQDFVEHGAPKLPWYGDGFGAGVQGGFFVSKDVSI
jgi:hypothetical protein